MQTQKQKRLPTEGQWTKAAKLALVFTHGVQSLHPLPFDVLRMVVEHIHIRAASGLADHRFWPSREAWLARQAAVAARPTLAQQLATTASAAAEASVLQVERPVFGKAATKGSALQVGRPVFGKVSPIEAFSITTLGFPRSGGFAGFLAKPAAGPGGGFVGFAAGKMGPPSMVAALGGGGGGASWNRNSGATLVAPSFPPPAPP
jgi:hypothetical protein